MPERQEGAAPIVFFDGMCGLCNRLVDRLVRADRRGVLRFAPLQGETARRMLGNSPRPEPGAEASDRADTLVFADERGIALRSEAVLRALDALGGVWRVSRLLRLVPRTARDALYDAVAVRRQRWFGRRTGCRVPGPSERERFLP